jgi:TetR/AcrR family transcriptional regulator, transcriptional repressor for nem operon
MSREAAKVTKDSTRSALLHAGARIIREKGYNHAGLQEILQISGVPKGSFYHFFASKEDFGLAIINCDAQTHDQEMERYFGDLSLSPLARLRCYFAAKCANFESLGCREGCLLGNLGQELADQNETFRLRIEAFFANWRSQLAQCLAQAQATGEIPTQIEPNRLADFLVNSWEGALMQMKVRKDSTPLHIFMDLIFGSLLPVQQPKE